MQLEALVEVTLWTAAMAQGLLAELSGSHANRHIPAHRRQLLKVAQELKDRLRFRLNAAVLHDSAQLL